MRRLFFGQVKDMETHLLRLQSDLQKCVSLIQDPRKLKSSLQTIYARYVSLPDQVSTGTGFTWHIKCKKGPRDLKSV